MSVKRYDLVGDMDGNCNLNEARMELSDDGVYVKYLDHLLLEQKLTDMAVQLANAESKRRELAAENAKLADCANFYRIGFKPVKGAFGLEWKPTEQLLDDCGNTAVEAIKTPATDALLAEVRAQGVEAFVMDFTEPAVMNNGTFYNEDLVEASNEFAAKLRKGDKS